MSNEQALSHIEETPDQTVMKFQLRDLEEEVNGVDIPLDSLKELDSRDGEINIVLTNFEVRFDKEATTAIVSQASGDTIYIKVEPIEIETLEEQQIASVEDKVVLVSLSASVISGGVNISNFWEGQATIMIPFEPEENVDIDEYGVVYIPKNGEIEPLDSHYEDECMIFSINHFSEYAIIRDATLKDALHQDDTLDGNTTQDITNQDETTLPTQTTTTNHSWIWIVTITLIALFAIFLLILIKRRNKEQ
jgi:tetrahydromethanopterin S-methyltransferase subunit B